MFVPVGVVTGWLWKWKGLWFAVGLSIVIELLQLITARGLCEFDDVFHNMIGAVMGILIIRDIWTESLIKEANQMG